MDNSMLAGFTYPETLERLRNGVMWLQTQERFKWEAFWFYPWYFTHPDRFESN